MYDIITVGSASVDVFVKTKGEVRKHHGHADVCYHLGDKLLIEDLFFSTGGGGTNTAVAFSRLGLKTGFLGVVGDDLHGEMVLKELNLEGVHFLGKKKKGKTGFSVILPGREDRTILAYKGVNNDLALGDIEFPLETKWLYLSTMLGEGLDVIEKLARYAKKNNITVFFNLSLYLAEKGINFLGSLLRKTDVLILNKEEVLALTREKDVKVAMKMLAHYVRGIIVVTDGPRPVYVYERGNFYIKRIKRVKPVDPTGAGDAFAAGFVYGIVKGENIDTAVSYGVKEAAAVLQHLGAKNHLLRSL